MSDLHKMCCGLDQEEIEYLEKIHQNIFAGNQFYNLGGLSFDGVLQNKSEIISNKNCSLENCDLTLMNNDSYPNEKTDNNSSISALLSVMPKLSETNQNPSKLFEDITNHGIDEEDLKYLKLGFKCLQYDENEFKWVSKLLWIEHPLTSSSGANRGCARTEEFHQVKKSGISRMRNKQHLKQPLGVLSNFVTTPYRKNYKVMKNTMSRNARNEQRRLYTAFESITSSNLLKLNELKFRKKKLRLGKSEIHGIGLYAAENIPANEIIIEYVGEIIRPIIADIREKKYSSSGIGSYSFRIDDETIIDATKRGNLSRFINHSCVPNSFSRVMTMFDKKKIVIYSKHAIKVDEEITYDYKMPIEQEKIMCLCKASGCRKTIN